MEAALMPDGWTWDRSWFSLARLMRDGEVIGEVSLNNGTWYGYVGGRQYYASRTLDSPGSMRFVMELVADLAFTWAAEVAARMA